MPSSSLIVAALVSRNSSLGCTRNQWCFLGTPTGIVVQTRLTASASVFWSTRSAAGSKGSTMLSGITNLLRRPAEPNCLHRFVAEVDDRGIELNRLPSPALRIVAKTPCEVGGIAPIKHHAFHLAFEIEDGPELPGLADFMFFGMRD